MLSTTSFTTLSGVTRMNSLKHIHPSLSNRKPTSALCLFRTSELLLPCYLYPCSCQCSPYRQLVAYFSPLSVLLLLYLLLNIFRHFEICFTVISVQYIQYGETQTGETYPAMMMSTFFCALFCILFIVNLFCSKRNTLVLSLDRCCSGCGCCL